MKERETFGSRLGFILVSAGCAIGLGNVWKFPYMAGTYGGAAFILIYLVFLVLLGLPVLVCEFAVGRASRKSTARAFHDLEPKGANFHNFSYMSMVSNYVLMMFYTMVAGWMLYYCYTMASGKLAGKDSAQVADYFTGLQDSAGTMTLWMIIVVVLSFGVCSLGVQRGLEKITKVMMICLLALIVVLAVHSLTLDGAMEGVKFYLVPDFAAMAEIGIGNVIFGALSQAFFTLSIGAGSMTIFGSYLGKDRSFWENLCILLMSFASLSTVIAVFENIISYSMDRKGWNRGKAVIVNMVAMILLSLPAVFGFNILSGIQPLGAGTNIMDLEDFIVSNNILPLGSVVFVMFCVSKYGWGWKRFIKEADTGEGLKFPANVQKYMLYVIPAIVVVIYLKGYYDMFSPKGPVVLTVWMLVSLLVLGLVGWIIFGKNKTK